MKKIIIIDDDEAIVEVTRMLFEQAGWQVHTFLQFPGFTMAESLKPDVMLLDYWMSGLSGIDLLQALQEHPGLSKVPRIVMSAMQQIESQIQGLEVKALIKKPFDIDELLTIAEKVSGGKQGIVPDSSLDFCC
jgi:DNA-binding response OmpR family regulator